MTENYEIVVIGQLTLDDVVLFDQPARLDSPGGSGLYALAGVCFWETGPLGFVTRQGNDYDLKPVFEKIENNVDLKGVNKLNAPSIHIWNLFDRKGNRYFIKQRWGSDDDIMGVLPEDIPNDYFNANAFLVAAYPVEWQSKVIRELPAGATILVDPHFQGVYPKYHEIWEELLEKTNIFLPSEEELLRYFSISPESDISNYIPFLKEVSNKGPEVVGVKLGERGVLVYDKNVQAAWHVPAYVEGSLVDVTGCGDVFCGGFLASYVRNRDSFVSAILGIVSSSLNLEDYGVIHNFSTKHEMAKQRFNALYSSLDRNKQKIL